MSDLTYSPEALDTLHLFHRRRYVVFVEGKEDVPFWRQIFEGAAVSDIILKVAGGRTEIDKYTAAITDSNANITVARDMDLDDLLGRTIDHNRVLYTYGYSIENTLCSPVAVARLIGDLGFSGDDYEESVHEWQEILTTMITPLVVLDLANRIEDAGVAIPLDNAHRLLERDGESASAESIDRLCSELEKHVSPKSLQEAERRLSASTKHLKHHIRGQFWITAVLHLVRERTYRVLGRRITLSYDALYGMLFGRCLIGAKACGEWQYYEALIARLQAA